MSHSYTFIGNSNGNMQVNHFPHAIFFVKNMDMGYGDFHTLKIKEVSLPIAPISLPARHLSLPLR
jgi:hypothetical protein